MMTSQFKFLLSMVLAVSLLASAANFGSAEARPIKILAMGTSLTQGMACRRGPNSPPSCRRR